MKIVDKRKEHAHKIVMSKDIPNGTWFEDRDLSIPQIHLKTSLGIASFNAETGCHIGDYSNSDFHSFSKYVALDVELVIKGVLPTGG